MSFLMNLCVLNVFERFGMFYLVFDEFVCFERYGTCWNVSECIRWCWYVLQRFGVYDVIVHECACFDTFWNDAERVKSPFGDYTFTAAEQV